MPFRRKYGTRKRYGTRGFKQRTYGARRRRAPARRRVNAHQYSRTTTVKRKVYQNAKKVNRIAKIVNASTGTKLYRSNQLALHTSAQSKCKYFELGFGRARLLSLMDNVQYVDPEDPTVPKYFNTGLAGGNDRDFLFTGISSKLVLRNNNKQDALVRMYCLVPKGATNLSPEPLIAAGMDARTEQIDPEEYPGGYLTDSMVLMDLYKIVQTKKIVLEAGKEMVMKYFHGPFTYNTALRAETGVDSDFSPEWGAHVYVFQIMGRATQSLAAPSGVGVGPAEVVSWFTTKLEAQYDAGGAIRQLDYDPVAQSTYGDSTSANQPVSGRQSFSPNAP